METFNKVHHALAHTRKTNGTASVKIKVPFNLSGVLYSIVTVKAGEVVNQCFFAEESKMGLAKTYLGKDVNVVAA